LRQQTTEIQTIPFRGGMNVTAEPDLLPPGGYSNVTNLRPRHPGFIKRKGLTKQHSTADTTNRVLSLYQFKKAKTGERHFLAQMSDGDILEATNAPPAITSGAFGSEVFSGSASQVAASWANLNDFLLHSNGVDQHQIWPGNSTYVGKLIVVKASAAIPIIPEEGIDYSDEVSDGLTSTYATLSSLDTLANHDAIFIKTTVPAKSFTWAFSALNADNATAQGHYWNGAWTAMTFTDGTTTGGHAFGQNGTMEWAALTDEVPKYQHGACGFWYRISLSGGALDASVTATGVTYEADWESIVNVWDGVPIDAIEAQVYDASATIYNTFGAASIDADAATTADSFYFSTPDLIEAFYVDVGDVPNTTASTTINAVSYHDGTQWQTIAGYVDTTSGLSKSGWVYLGRQTGAKPIQFESTQYYAYWWKFTVDQTLSADVNFGITYMPFFDVSELGKGQSCCAWKNRMCYSFDRWGEYIYITAQDAPMTLNGDDYGIVRAGDGRRNKVVSQRQFHNELLVWQEELGAEGGCLTLFEGYSPTTFGKLLLSSRLGAMNANCTEVVDGILTRTETDEKIKTIAFALSRYGVYACDGMVCSFIDASIKKHFDPTRTTDCIRRGYESKMWIKWDSAYSVLRVGLVTGTSATNCNTFLVFDPSDRTWSYDTIAQEISCMAEIEAASGDVPVLQVGGGIDDGTFIWLIMGVMMFPRLSIRLLRSNSTVEEKKSILEILYCVARLKAPVTLRLHRMLMEWRKLLFPLR